MSIDYRMLPAADPSVQAEDVARAIAFVQAPAVEWGGDPARVVAMGHSAGAHLVSLLAAAPEIGARMGARPVVATVALDSAALDVPAIMRERHLPLYDTAFGRDAAFWEKVSPADRLTRAPAPMLLVCSTRRAASCDQARAFAVRVHAVGGRADVSEQPLSHMEINHDLGRANDLTAAVDRFFSDLDLP